MPDDTIPEGTNGSTEDPGDGPPTGTDEPTSSMEAAAPGGPEDPDATSMMPSTPAADATGDPEETSVMGATSAPASGDPDATTLLGTTAAAPEAAALADSADGSPPAKRTGLNRTWVIAIVVVVVILAGAGIALAVTSGSKPKKAAGSRPPTSAATMIPATTPTGPACPLTGQPAPGGQVPQRPALAFKVDNYPAARPQSGIEDADVVFEEPVEGGITRLVAIFQCQSVPLVGPIRSARAIDVPILDQLSKPLFVHAGGINPVIALVNAANLINDDVFTHGSVVQHVPGRYAPYNTYASTSSIWALNPSDTSPPAPLYTYAATAPTGTPVGSVSIPFSGTNDNTWTWSPFNSSWLLSIGGVPANVLDGGSRIGVANIVVQTVHITYGPWLENSEGGLEVQAQLTGSGPLAVFRNGEEITGTWQRSALTDTTNLVAADGSTIALEPGKTWVELVPSTIPVTTAAPAKSAP